MGEPSFQLGTGESGNGGVGAGAGVGMEPGTGRTRRSGGRGRKQTPGSGSAGAGEQAFDLRRSGSAPDMPLTTNTRVPTYGRRLHASPVRPATLSSTGEQSTAEDSQDLLPRMKKHDKMQEAIIHRMFNKLPYNVRDQVHGIVGLAFNNVASLEQTIAAQANHIANLKDERRRLMYEAQHFEKQFEASKVTMQRLREETKSTKEDLDISVHTMAKQRQTIETLATHNKTLAEVVDLMETGDGPFGGAGSLDASSRASTPSFADSQQSPSRGSESKADPDHDESEDGSHNHHHHHHHHHHHRGRKRGSHRHRGARSGRGVSADSNDAEEDEGLHGLGNTSPISREPRRVRGTRRVGAASPGHGYGTGTGMASGHFRKNGLPVLDGGRLQATTLKHALATLTREKNNMSTRVDVLEAKNQELQTELHQAQQRRRTLELMLSEARSSAASGNAHSMRSQSEKAQKASLAATRATRSSQEVLSSLDNRLADMVEKNAVDSVDMLAQMRRLHVVSVAISSSLRTEDIGNRVVDRMVGSIFHCEFVTFFVRGARPGEVLRYATASRPQSYEGSEIGGIVGHTLLTGAAVRANDASSNPHFDAAFDSYKSVLTKSCMTLPVFATDRRTVLGALQLINKRNGQIFSEVDELLGEFLITQLGMVLITTKRLGGIVRHAEMLSRSLTSPLRFLKAIPDPDSLASNKPVSQVDILMCLEESFRTALGARNVRAFVVAEPPPPVIASFGSGSRDSNDNSGVDPAAAGTANDNAADAPASSRLVMLSASDISRGGLSAVNASLSSATPASSLASTTRQSVQTVPVGSGIAGMLALDDSADEKKGDTADEQEVVDGVHRQSRAGSPSLTMQRRRRQARAANVYEVLRREEDDVLNPQVDLDPGDNPMVAVALRDMHRRLLGVVEIVTGPGGLRSSATAFDAVVGSANAMAGGIAGQGAGGSSLALGAGGAGTADNISVAGSTSGASVNRAVVGISVADSPFNKTDYKISLRDAALWLADRLSPFLAFALDQLHVRAKRVPCTASLEPMRALAQDTPEGFSPDEVYEAELMARREAEQRTRRDRKMTRKYSKMKRRGTNASGVSAGSGAAARENPLPPLSDVDSNPSSPTSGTPAQTPLSEVEAGLPSREGSGAVSGAHAAARQRTDEERMFGGSPEPSPRAAEVEKAVMERMEVLEADLQNEWSTRLEEAEAQCIDLRAQLEDQQKELRALKEQLSSAQAGGSLSSQNDALSHQLSDAKAREEEIEQENSVLSSELENAHAALADSQEDVARLESQVAEMSVQLKAISSSAAAPQSEAEAPQVAQDASCADADGKEAVKRAEEATPAHATEAPESKTDAGADAGADGQAKEPAPAETTAPGAEAVTAGDEKQEDDPHTSTTSPVPKRSVEAATDESKDAASSSSIVEGKVEDDSRFSEAANADAKGDAASEPTDEKNADSNVGDAEDASASEADGKASEPAESSAAESAAEPGVRAEGKEDAVPVDGQANVAGDGKVEADAATEGKAEPASEQEQVPEPEPQHEGEPEVAASKEQETAPVSADAAPISATAETAPPNEEGKTAAEAAADPSADYRRVGEWVELFDDGGNAYWYNETTGASEWELPANAGGTPAATSAGGAEAADSVVDGSEHGGANANSAGDDNASQDTAASAGGYTIEL